MDETKVTTGIILKNSPFRERDSRVEICTEDFGRVTLVARGTKNVQSKFRGHIEPLTQVKLMIVKGRAFNYLGAVTTKEAFLRLRDDYDNLILASKALKIYLDFIKEDDNEKDFHDLLFYFFDFLNKEKIKSYDLFYSFFTLKFLNLLGLKPELYSYLDTGKKIEEKKHCFSLKEGGLVEERQSEHCLFLSVEAIKVLRLVIESDFFDLNKISINKNLENEITGIVRAFFNYQMVY